MFTLQKYSYVLWKKKSVVTIYFFYKNFFSKITGIKKINIIKIVCNHYPILSFKRETLFMFSTCYLLFIGEKDV